MPIPTLLSQGLDKCGDCLYWDDDGLFTEGCKHDLGADPKNEACDSFVPKAAR